MKSKKIQQGNRKSIIIFAVIASFVLYFVGVFSGLYANKLIKEETKSDIESLKNETANSLQSMQNYIDFLDTNLKSMQLDETFTDTLNPDEMCNYLSISLDEIIEQLGYYWSRLPYRIEEYEKNNELTPEYLALKQQYTHLSIRTWLLAKKEYEKCDMNIVHGLYFYSIKCGECVRQGEEIDNLNKMILASGSKMIMFPLDFDSGEIIIKNLKNYYNITATPSIMINGKVFQGRLFKAEELMDYPKKNKNGQS